MKSIGILELKSIIGGYYYTNEEVEAMMNPENGKTAEKIGYAVGRALAFISVVVLTKRF